MARVGNPLKIPELDLRPEPLGGVELSENMQQTLALLTAFWRNQRVVLKASPSGVLFTASPQLEDIFHVTGVGANDVYQGSNIQCSEVLVMGHPDNAGKIWARSKKVATVDNAWPLAAGDVMGFTITNLNMLHLLIVVDGDKVIVAYTL
jgi:hypothetical protein